jgi:hypothetical protein
MHGEERKLLVRSHARFHASQRLARTRVDNYNENMTNTCFRIFLPRRIIRARGRLVMQTIVTSVYHVRVRGTPTNGHLTRPAASALVF